MSKRETDIKRIADYFALAENVLNNKAILGYNDDSRAWEDVICRVINIAYSWKLVNLNKSTNNYPGIDLGDEERRIGVQVTKEHTSDKVNSTLDKIIRNKVYERYSEIYVFVLGHRQKTYQIKEGEQAGPLSVYDEYKVYGERGSSCNVNTIIASGRNTVVLAGPGMGKSTLCKKLFMLADGEGKCAARVRLWDIAKYMRQGMVFEESLRMAMAAPLSFCLSKAELDNIFSVLILDGLDECGDISRTVANDISEWSNGQEEGFLKGITMTTRNVISSCI